MSEQQLTETRPKTGVAAISEYLNGKAVSEKFQGMMGKRATAFITSVLHVCANNELLKHAEPTSVYQAAAVAATLDLPINNNLGFAYIIPYKEKRTDGQGRDYEVVIAQFQMGYKGFIQLAQRSGQFKYIGASPIFEGQLVEHNPLTGNRFNFAAKTSEKVIGYAAGFVLLNGFDTTFYMPVEKIEAHAKRYSKTYHKSSGRWKLDFEGMATKTVIKLLLSKYAPLSVETIQSAIAFDQASIKNFETKELEYVDANAEVIPEEYDWLAMEELFAEKKEKLSPEEQTASKRVLDNKETASYKKLESLLKSRQ
jgi:recombination protein RecT